MSLTLTFPGQGSQAVGMGREFYDNFPVARQVFQEVDEALSVRLSDLIFNGSEADLTLTYNTQPALMVTSMAIVRTLEAELGLSFAKSSLYFAGHSLGEYTALCAAGALSLWDTARLLRKRGQAMQRAAPLGQGLMAAILGLELAAIEEILIPFTHTKEICTIANDNSPGQVVISGHKEAVEHAMALCLEKGAKRALALTVSAPFHSPLMEPAAHEMAEALDQTTFSPISGWIIANVTATCENNPLVLKELLIKQVTGRVRWRESLLSLPLKSISSIAEIGAGKVLTGLAKRTVGDIEAFAVNTPQDLQAIIKKFQ